MLSLGLAERCRTLAIAGALGAPPGQLAAFVWAEAVVVTAGGLAAVALTAVAAAAGGAVRAAWRAPIRGLRELT